MDRKKELEMQLRVLRGELEQERRERRMLRDIVDDMRSVFRRLLENDFERKIEDD